MDKVENMITNYNHSINMVERKNMMVTGIKKIENFDSEEFLIDTSMGYLIIKGTELELVKLDTVSGSISIKGLINSFSYVDDFKNKNKENSFLNRLFK